MPTTKPTPFVMNGTQRRALVSAGRIYCTYCDVPKGISRDEVTLNRKKSSP